MGISIQKKYFFKYLILDSILSDNDLEYFNNSFNVDIQPSDKLGSFFSIKIFRDKRIHFNFGENQITQNKIMEIHNKYEKTFHTLLSEMCPAKLKLHNYTEYTLNCTGKDYKYAIHDDIPSKLLSAVIYLKPEENTGTIIYPSPEYKLWNGELAFPSEGTLIHWKQNRGFVFSRIHQKTWHSYQGDTKKNRLTLIINICSDKVKEVMEIENSKEFKDSITWTN